jgi:hypothetical protein
VPKRKPLPAHLPRQETVLAPGDACAACGGKLKRLGEDVTEELDYVPGRFVVNRIVRPRLACTCHLDRKRQAERCRSAGAWPVRARSSPVASFATGIMKDEAAVTAALNLPWSKGQTEGQITKLKLVKRQMYGRGKIDMLQARMTCAT